MFKPRWILVLLAIFVAAVLVDFTRRTANAKPRTMLEAGRAALEGEEPDFDGALLHLERGITLARAQDDPDALQDLLRAYAATYLGRWERGVTSPDQAAIESDLDEVLRICQSCVLEFGPEDPDLLRMGARAAFDAGRPALAISFLQQLFDLVPATPELDLLFGRAQLAAVEQTLASLTDRLIKVEPEADPTLLEETLRRAITLPFADPRRAAEIEKLSRDLPAIHRRPLLAKLETGSRSLQRATAAFQKVLDREPNGKAVVGLLRILLLADSVDRAAELVAIGLETPGLTDRQELVRTSLSAFLDLDRREQADRLCERFLGVDSDLLDPEVLLRSDRVAWCPLLLRLELWPALRAIAQSVLNEDWENHFSDEDTERTRFYYAIALSHVGSASAARPQLLRTDPKGRELYPGMRMEWAEALGRCDLKLQDERSAHHDLLVATNAIPREGLSPRLARVAGHAWKAYGELLASDRDYLRAEDALTRALELLPKERRRIEPTWRSVGEAALRKRGRTLGFLERSPLERTPAGGFPPMGAFEACTRARLGLERGLVGAIPLLLQPILDSYPRLPLALELLARTEMLRGRFDRAIDAELALLEAGQRSEAGLELLRSIPETAFTGSQRRRWILHDPVAAGWTAIVEELARSGDHRGLRSMLEHTDRGALRPTQLLRAARIAAEDGATSQALSLLAALPDSSPERAAGIGLQLALSIRLAQRTHSPAPLRQCLGRPFPKKTTPPLAESPQLLSAIAWALADGDGGLVRPILQASAEQRSDARGEALLLL
ncbi:MAG TPA: tetratricopeptide repeat protein, partial [Planctomycetes bacterium]|nr:tetratricopeptide repeat protein [Planctomycetota bacterium]